MPRKAKKEKVKGSYRRGANWQIDTSYKGIRIRELVATKEMAEKALKKAQTLIDEDRYLEKKRKPTITLSAFADLYLKWYRNEGRKAYSDRERRIRHVCNSLGKDLLLADIDAKLLESYKETRLATPKNEKGEKIKPATINRELAYFKHMFTKAVDWGTLAENPLRRVKLLKEQNHSLRYLTGKEVTKLTGAASAYMRPVITVALNTGLREGEILRLKWSDLKFQSGLIELLDQKNGERSYVPMNEATREALRKVPRRLDSPYVFCKADGRPPVDFRRTFYKAIKKAGIAYCRFHDLRHTFASHLAMNGADLLTIKELLRHKTLAMTLRYAHLSDQHTRRAVDELTFKSSEREKKAAKKG